MKKSNKQASVEERTEDGLSLTQTVAARIKSDCVDHSLSDRLPSERKLVEKYGWSRTVIRPALALLEQQGQVKAMPGGRIRYIERPQVLQAVSPLSSLASMIPANLDRRVALRIMAMDTCESVAGGISFRWNDWMRQFEKENRRIAVNLIGWSNDVWLKNLPIEADLAEAPVSDSVLHHAGGGIQPLNDLIRADRSFNQKLYNESLWKEGLLNGTRCAVPVGTVLPLLLTSRETWDRFGSGTVPQAWSWEEFEPVLKKCKAATGSPAFSVQSPYSLLSSLGFDTESETPDDAGLKGWLERIRDNIHLPTLFEGTRNILTDVMTGRIGFLPLSTAYIYRALSICGDQAVFLPHPCQANGYLPRTTLGMFLTQASEAPIECWQCIRHLLSLGVQRDLARNGHMFPVLNSAASAIWRAPEVNGGTEFLTATFERSLEACLPYTLMSEAQARIMIPELHAWQTGEEPAGSMLFRIRMMVNLMRDRNLRPSG